MEDSAAKDQSSAASARSASRLLRYPLRSASKSKEENPTVVDPSNSVSATKRGRVASSVSKSVSVLDLSGKDKSAKPPRRLSVPSKSNVSPAPKSFGNITPISEARAKRSAGNQGKSDTPVSEVSKSTARKKFSILSSSSYWLSQIKLSESAAKHSISLGFFKLALEAGCEPIQKMSDELKSYVGRHNLSELGDNVKELFQSYKIPEESYEQSQVSETCSKVSAEGNQISDDDIHSSSSSIITDAERLKPKSLDINADEINQVEKANDETVNQKDESAKKTTKSVGKNAAASTKSGSEVRGRGSQKKPQIPIKQEYKMKNQGKKSETRTPIKQEYKLKNQGKKSARDKGPLDSPPEEEALQENKENMAAPEMEEIGSTEV